MNEKTYGLNFHHYTRGRSFYFIFLMGKTAVDKQGLGFSESNI